MVSCNIPITNKCNASSILKSMFQIEIPEYIPSHFIPSDMITEFIPTYNILGV